MFFSQKYLFKHYIYLFLLTNVLICYCLLNLFFGYIHMQCGYFSSLFETDGLLCSPSILNIAQTLPSTNSINTFLLEIEFLIDSYFFSLYSQEKSTVKLLEGSCQYIVIFLKVIFSLWLLLGYFIVQNFSIISF